MISKETALDALKNYHEISLGALIDDGALKIRSGNYEYKFDASEVKYVGTGEEFLAYHYDFLNCDGVIWITGGSVTLGGKDFQISGKAYEDADDMTARRKIFELYTSNELNISLYSSGAGKNLDLFINCGGVYDNYNEPAILEREYEFALKWRQAEKTLTLTIDGEEIYSIGVEGLSEPQTFEQLLIGGSVYHTNATWRGTISEFKIYDGYAEA